MIAGRSTDCLSCSHSLTAACGCSVVARHSRHSDVAPAPCYQRSSVTREAHREKMGKLKKTPLFRHPLYLNEAGKVGKENTIDKKKALKTCIKKLRHIADAESQLHQAVLLNNTLQRIREYKPLTEPSTNNNDRSRNRNIWSCSDENHDLFSEINLPPPLNTNQLELLSTKSSENESLWKDINDEDKLNQQSIYLHTITTYHLEDEINLYESLRDCDNLLISNNIGSLQRTQ